MWLYALLDMSYKPAEFANKTIPPQFSCEMDADPYWKDGDVIYRCVAMSSISVTLFRFFFFCLSEDKNSFRQQENTQILKDRNSFKQ